VRVAARLVGAEKGLEVYAARSVRDPPDPGCAPRGRLERWPDEHWLDQAVTVAGAGWKVEDRDAAAAALDMLPR